MPEITHGPLHATRIEFCFRTSGAHVGVWAEPGLFHLDLFDEGKWVRLFSKPGYSSIPLFIDYCLGEATPSETDNEADDVYDVHGNNPCTSWDTEED